MPVTHGATLMGEGNLLQLSVTILLLLVAIFELTEVYSVVAPICLCLFADGAVRPTAAGVYMTFLDQNSGAAAFIHMTLLSMLGALVGALVGALSAMLSEETLIPVFSIMLVCSATVRGVLMAIRRTAVAASYGSRSLNNAMVVRVATVCACWLSIVASHVTIPLSD